MHTITVNLSSDEWNHVQQKARKLWPGERISQAEILGVSLWRALRRSKHLDRRIANLGQLPEIAVALLCSKSAPGTMRQCDNASAH
jgi:hypothetical protein